MHDVLDLYDLVPDELAQLEVSGHDPAALGALRPLVEAAVTGRDGPALERLMRRLAAVDRSPDWRYDEPSDRASLAAFLSGVVPAGHGWQGSRAALLDRIYGAWLGRCTGCILGKPVEGLRREEVSRYLAAADANPFLDYLPLLDPLPDGVSHLHESAPFATRGNFDCTPRDDDIDWAILTLHLLETHPDGPSTRQIADAWLDMLPFTQTFTAERAAYRNLLHGLQPPETATARNPYREWVGALIRADVYGYTRPGRPDRAALLALDDALLSHVQNGIYGELWAAALVSAAFTSADARTALLEASRYVPPSTRLHEALELVLDLHESGITWDACMDRIDAALGHYDWVHTVNNAAHIAAGLLWGAGDFTTTVTLTIRAGADTDSSAATAGSVFGALHGTAALPERLTAPLQDQVRSAVRGFDRVAITELAQRTAALVPATPAASPAIPPPSHHGSSCAPVLQGAE